VTGKTVDEATERALDQLGVALDDAEVIVVSEPKTGLFGRVREEARVRARVRPVGARPKRERSRRAKPNRQGGGQRSSSGSGGRSSNNGGRGGDGGGSGRSSDGSGDEDETSDSPREAVASAGAVSGGGAVLSQGTGDGSGSSRAGGTGAGGGTGTSRSARRRRNRSRAGVSAGHEGSNGAANGSTREKRPAQTSAEGKVTKETVEMAEGMTLEEQGEAGRVFLVGLLGEYGMEGSVETRLIDEETVEIAAMGDDLGILVGPRGSNLSALQDLTRAVVQRQCPSRTDRILVDVAGYREKRSAALKRFSVQIAEEVLSSGQEKALEPMSPADRKSVHDAINEMAGVVTRSEGEDPNRHIVIAPGG